MPIDVDILKMSDHRTERDIELYSWGEKVGEEICKSYNWLIESGFISKYLSGPNILDIGYRGYSNAVPIVPQATGVDIDFPGYDGCTLPFPELSQDAVFSSHTLQHILDYRSSLREWFRVLRVGGYLIIIVPHQYLYEKKLALPSRFNTNHKRFYTPATLLMELEEALDPLSYRVRLLQDNDAEYDHTVDVEAHSHGCYEVLMVIEKVERPIWADSVLLPCVKPKIATRPFTQPKKNDHIERIVTFIPNIEKINTILVIKLDHRGDLLLAQKSVRALRAAFPDANITLACGPWNVDTALKFNIFNHIIPVEFFPENPGQSTRVIGLTEQLNRFEHALLGKHFDIAIDLRIDPDSREALTKVGAKYRVGFGTSIEFPFLDFNLPFKNPTNSDRAASTQILANSFSAVDGSHEGYRIRVGNHDVGVTIVEIKKRLFRLFEFFKGTINKNQRLKIFGPYAKLEEGIYEICPIVHTKVKELKLSFELTEKGGDKILGVGEIDVGGDRKPRCLLQLATPTDELEFRIYGADHDQFDFFGIDILKRGLHSNLHQEEAMLLLVLMTAMHFENLRSKFYVTVGN